MKPDDPRHGTTNGYSNLRCRCQPCRDAWTVYHRDYMHRSPEQRLKHQRRAHWRRVANHPSAPDQTR